MEGQLDLKLAAASRQALSVTQLVRMVSATLEANLAEFWVEGEVSNARIPASGHLYFTLKDERSAISVVMFRGVLARLRFKLEDGMAIVVRGRVNVFEVRGALQVVAAEVEPRGVGALQVAFEQLKRRLEAEGLFDAGRKRPLPFLPRTVGVVTARGGAGLRDILRVMLDRFPNLRVIVRPAKVQGEGAARDICEAIEDLNRDGRTEVMIVGRGGGSLEDLWAFNEEAVARAIFRSKIPVVSAVGHEIDYTIADFVADLRAPTPTAAATMVVPSRAELAERIEDGAAALAAGVRRELSAWREAVDDLSNRLRHPALAIRRAREDIASLARGLDGAIAGRIADSRRDLRELTIRLHPPGAMLREVRTHAASLALALAHAISERLRERRASLGELAARLDSLSPLRVLERGYAVVTNSRDGRVVVDSAAVQDGDELDIRLARGGLRARTVARESRDN
jgi:exodeoxyribonuclease VII large subunit